MIEPDVSNKNQKRELISYASLVLSATAFFGLCGIKLVDSALIIGICTSQIAIGSSIWRKTCRLEMISVAERLGMGGAVGFSLSLISSRLFGEVAPRAVSWLLIPILFWMIIELYNRRREGQSKQSLEQRSKKCNLDIQIFISGTLFALSTSWYWLVPSALTFAGFLFGYHIFQISRLKGKRALILSFIFSVPVALFGIRAIYNLAQVETIRNPLWWTLRLGLYEDPDLVFNESMINSVSRFGTSDSIFFAGSPMQYHWMSFGWEATLGSFRDLQPFVVSGVAAPVIVYFIIMCLVYLVAETLTENKYVPAISVAFVAMMCAGPIPLLRILNPHSFSYNFSLIFVFAILFLLAKLSFKFSATQLLIFGLLSFAAVGSKFSNSVAIGFGLGSTFLISLFRKSNVRATLTLNLVYLLALVFLWFSSFSTGGGQRTHGIRLGFGELFIQKANYFWSSATPVLVIGFLSMSLVVLFTSSGLLSPNSGIWNSRILLGAFVLATGFGALTSAFILTDDYESSTYLVGVGLAILAPASIASLGNSISKIKVPYYSVLIVSIAFGMLAAGVWDYLYDRLDPTYDDPTSSSRQIKQSLVILIPLFGAILSGLVVALSTPVERVKLSKIAFSVCLLVSVAASYFANSRNFYSTSVNNREISEEIATPIFGSGAYRELLDWVANNSFESDLLATNRQCLTLSNDPKSCVALWSLTSAITNRQNLVEGVYPPRTEHLTTERERRWNAVIGFVDNPADQNRDALIEYGVKWVVADHAITNTRNWEPFATERFKNLAGSILELNP